MPELAVVSSTHLYIICYPVCSTGLNGEVMSEASCFCLLLAPAWGLLPPLHRPPLETPSQATGAGTLSAISDAVCCSAGPPAAAPTPSSSEPSTGGTDCRGRQRITWQPPTTSQKDEDAQVLLLIQLLLSSVLCACPRSQSVGHSMSAACVLTKTALQVVTIAHTSEDSAEQDASQ